MFRCRTAFRVYAFYDARVDQFGELGKRYGSEPGAALDGTKSYAATFPAGQEPPVIGFWSLPLYNEQHLFHPNGLGRYSLGTKNKGLQKKRGRLADAVRRGHLPQGAGRRATGSPRRTARSRSTSGLTGARCHPRRHLAATRDRGR